MNTIVRVKTSMERVTPEKMGSIIRSMLKDTLNMSESIFVKDNVLYVGTQFRLRNNGLRWTCQTASSNDWRVCHPIITRDPLQYLERIIMYFSRKKLGIWLMTNHGLVA